MSTREPEKHFEKQDKQTQEQLRQENVPRMDKPEQKTPNYKTPRQEKPQTDTQEHTNSQEKITPKQDKQNMGSKTLKKVALKPNIVTRKSEQEKQSCKTNPKKNVKVAKDLKTLKEFLATKKL